MSPATELLINYFWLHWIYLGLVWGVIMIAALSAWLRVLGVPSAAFCWVVWAILGQASGAYVGPTCWAVLFLAAAVAVLHQRRYGPAGDASDGLRPSKSRLGHGGGRELTGRRSRQSSRAGDLAPQMKPESEGVPMQSPEKLWFLLPHVAFVGCIIALAILALLPHGIDDAIRWAGM